MSIPSARFKVNGGSVSTFVAVPASSTVTLALESTQGVSPAISWTVIGTHAQAAAKPVITPGGFPLGVTATFPVPSGSGQTYLIECKLDNALNELQQYDANRVFRVLCYVAAANGAILLAYGETTERGTNAYVDTLNTAISASGGGGGGSTTFTGLTDTLSSYTGQAGKTLVVRGDETGLEAIVAPIVKIYDTLSALKAITPVTGERYLTRSHTALGDSGGGTWRGVSGSPSGTYTDNGITVIRPTGGDGSSAFLRDDVVEITPEMAGCKGDNSTDDRVALRSAIRLAASLGVWCTITKTHVVSAGMSIDSTTGVRLRGNGTIRMTGSNKTILYGAGCHDFETTGITWKGNNTGQGVGGAAQETGGGAIHLSGSDGVKISGKFRNFGLPGSSPVSSMSVINLYDCKTPVLDSPDFDGSNDGASTSEITFTLCSNTHVIAHRSYAETGGANVCVSYAGSGFFPDKSKQHVVLGGTFYRGPDTASRHAILGNYGSFPQHLNIVSPNIEGFAWTGIYFNSSGENELGTTASGGLTVTGGIIRYCGGLVNGITGGIWVASRAGATINGTLIESSGRQSDGTTRANAAAAHGININPWSKNVRVEGAMVMNGEGHGVYIYCNQTGKPSSDIKISVTAIGNKLDAIRAYVGATSEECLTDVDFDGCQINTGSLNVAGINLYRSNNATFDRVNIRGCTLRSTCNQTTATSAVALRIGGPTKGIIDDNTIDGYNKGIFLPASGHRSFDPYVGPGNKIHNTKFSVTVLGAVAVRPVAALITGTSSNPVSDGVRQGAKKIAHIDGTTDPIEWRHQGTLPDAQYYRGDRSLFIASQELGISGYHCRASDTTWAGAMVPFYENIPLRPWSGSASVADAGTLVQTLAEVEPGGNEAVEVTYRYRVGVTASPNVAMGLYIVTWARGSSGLPFVAGQGFHGAAPPTGWTFFADVSGALPRLTLTNSTTASQLAYIEPTARKIFLS